MHQPFIRLTIIIIISILFPCKNATENFCRFCGKMETGHEEKKLFPSCPVFLYRFFESLVRFLAKTDNY